MSTPAFSRRSLLRGVGIAAGNISPHGWCRFYVKK